MEQMESQDGQNNESQQNGTVTTKPGQDDNRKLFVGGLDLETTEAQIKEYFGQYGMVQNVNLKTNPQTGKSKGFAFVVFGSEESMTAALAVSNHTIANKAVDVKKAKARPGKIFVGGITQEITDEDIRGHFSQYGNITNVEMPFDKTKNQRKAFCFITFDSEQIVRDLLKTPKQYIKGKAVDVKRANQDQKGSWGWQQGGGGGWGGPGGWGGQGGYGGGGWGGQGGYGGGYGGGYDSYGGYGGGYTDFAAGGGGGYGGGGYQSGPGFGGKAAPARGRGRGRGGRPQPY